VLLPSLNSGHRSLACIEDGRRLACVNGGLQERPGFNGGRLTFKRRRLVLKSRRPMVGAEVHGSRQVR
jgi:hypothetical protein